MSRKPEKKLVARDLSGARILVAGATGFLGSYVSAALSAQGAHVTPLSRKGGFDLRNEAEVLQAVLLTHPDMIVDVAGPSGGISYLASKPASTFRDTVQIGMNLVHAASSARVRLIAVGNPASYPGDGPAVMRENSFWSGYPHPMVAIQGVARKAVLTMMQAYKAQHGLNFFYLVPATVYGPNDHFDGYRASVMAAMIRRFVHAVEDRDEQVVCWGVAEAVRSFLFAPDLAKAVATACATDTEHPDLINLAGPTEITLGSLATRIAQETGFSGKIVWDPEKPVGAARRVLDGRLAKKLLGWEAETSLEDGLKLTIDWYMKNKPKE